MKYIKFPSLVNVQKTKVVKDAAMFKDVTWTVTEKIHGANMGLYSNGTEFKVASRSGFTDRNFFGCAPVVAEIESELHRLANVIRKELDTSCYIILYGEYYGGLLDGAENVPNAKKVQKGVQYSPRNHFSAFLMLIVSEDGVSVPFTTGDVTEVFKHHDIKIPVCEILHKGSLKSCLDYANEFDSTIPSLHGYTVTDNVCEGTVIMPDDGIEYELYKLPIFKNKNSKWKEKEVGDVTQIIVDDEVTDPYLKEILPYITRNRFDNVVSKVGEVDPKMIGKYIGLMLKDVHEDYVDEGGIYPEDPHERKALNRRITQAVREVIIKAVLYDADE